MSRLNYVVMWCVLMDLYRLLLQLVTVFSAPNYCGEFDNAGGLLKVSENLTCSFSIVPVSRHSSLVPRPSSKGLGTRLQTLWLARLPPDTHCASKQTLWMARLGCLLTHMRTDNEECHTNSRISDKKTSAQATVRPIRLQVCCCFAFGATHETSIFELVMHDHS